MRTRDKVIAVGSAAGALAAVATALAATACCAGPAMFAILGASGAIAAAGLHPYRIYFAVGGLALLAFAFWRAYAPRAVAADGATCTVRSGRFVRITLWISLALTLAAGVVAFLID